ncbi:MAG: hypothetical protein ACKVTZ_04235 [Bacteroidia bacterium]
MANSIDDFLSKSSPEKQEQFKKLALDFDKAVGGTAQEADKNPTANLRQTKEASPQGVEEAQKTTERNDPTKGNEQTPQQAQTAQNAVDKALDRQTKAEVSQIGQTLAKEGVTAQPQDKER